MDALAIINKYYPEDNELKHILLAHSRSVADKACLLYTSPSPRDCS